MLGGSPRIRGLAVGIVAWLSVPRLGAQTSQASTRDANVWFSAGLGTGSVTGSFAADLSLWYADDRLALGVQGNADDAIIGEARESLALLGGVTHESDHERDVAAVGLASLRSFTCSENAPCAAGNRNLALAFAGEAFLHASVIGLGLDAFGALGTQRTSYIAIAVALQLGWLGKSP